MGGAPDETLLEYVLGLAPRKAVALRADRRDGGPDADGLVVRAAARTCRDDAPALLPLAALRTYASWRSPTTSILVTGGNTANALAVWRVHGFDEILREAWQQGVVLAGWSAGMICWFEHGVTDSFGPELAPMECLGFLPGSACPHYDGEERRRPVYTRLVAEGLPAGVAADDDVALHYVGTELREVVTSAKAPPRIAVEPGRRTSCSRPACCV